MIKSNVLILKEHHMSDIKEYDVWFTSHNSSLIVYHPYHINFFHEKIILINENEIKLIGGYDMVDSVIFEEAEEFYFYNTIKVIPYSKETYFKLCFKSVNNLPITEKFK